MSNQQVVLAFFPTEAWADSAVETLKEWDAADDGITLGAIGVLALDARGTLKAQKLGRPTVGKGAGIGLVLALLTPVGLGAVVAGGALGALHRKGLGFTAEERERVAAQLGGGRAAVGVLVTVDQAAAVATKLVQLGGTTETHDVPDEVAAEVEAAAPQVEAEAAADRAGAAPDEATEASGDATGGASAEA